MFVLYAFLTAILLTGIGIFYLKMFQLENYKIKKYILKALKFEFGFGDKSVFVWTDRIKRLIFCDFLANFCIFLLIFWQICNYFSVFIVLDFAILKHLEIVLTFLISYPIESLIKFFYINKAKKKLKKMHCKKIAITGSFGKTSTKNILYQILKEEFDVCMTPKSYNTPMGVCKTILNDLKETDDFFIVEFGARHRGDIKFLTKFVGVDFGIFTPIGNCHIETFGSIENIEKTKYELCENGEQFVVFNGKSKSTKKLYEKYPKRKVLTCVKDGFAYAKNIRANKNGSSFDLHICDQVLTCKTKLLGKANIDNIVVASSMAYLLGETLYSILKGIEKLDPIPHRLEIVKGGKATIIDDSYNSNFEGFCQALEVLNMFDGRKIVVSPGVVELGNKQYETNFQLGEMVFEVADIFVIMNKTNKEALSQGAKKYLLNSKNKDKNTQKTQKIVKKIKKNNKKQVFFANTRAEQVNILKNILQDGDVVLFENDLPDNFK